MMQDKKGTGPRRGPGPDDVPHSLILSLFNSVSDGVMAVDMDMRITAINESALDTLGLVLHQAMGRPVDDVLKSDDPQENSVLRETLDAGRSIVDRDLLIEDARGLHIPVRLSTMLLRGSDGEVLGCGATFRNLVQVKELLADADRSRPFQDIVTGDPNMRRLFSILPTIARADSSVLLLGETGTGKSLLVKTLHNLSPRRKGPLITVNCAALPETLLEAELFGVRAGAFTGATRDRPGRLAAADGGTLFLDEIGDIPLNVQVKLLRVLQERIYERLGDVRQVSCNVRCITATHQNLEQMCNQGTFRRDLFYRINVLNLEIPPLRERKGDIPLLAQRFLDRLSMRSGRSVAGVSSRVLEILTAHDYPGNIRELENIIEHAWVMCRTGIVEPPHLPKGLLGGNDQVVNPIPKGKSGLPRLEADYIRQVIHRHDGCRATAAEELGIHRTTLQRKIRKLGLDLPPGDGRSRGAGNN